MELGPEMRNCDLCSENGFEIVYRPGEANIHQVVRCNGCGLMYANPLSHPPDVQMIKTWAGEQWSRNELDRFILALLPFNYLAFRRRGMAFRT